MRLNGIQAEPGTIIGVHKESLRFLTVIGEDEGGVVVRYSTAEEVTPHSFMHEPRSVAEHHAIKRRMSPYGMVRRFKPVPVTPVKVEIPIAGPNFNREQRRAFMRRMKRN